MCKAYHHLVTGEARAELRNTSAIILAAGRGRRLSPFTDSLPKPLLPVLNLPILLWTMARLSRIGIKDVFANIHYLPEAFHNAAAICELYGSHLHLVYEAHPTGPLGGAMSCRSKLHDSNLCLILSGDALHDIDFHKLVAAHRASGSDLTLAVTRVRNGQRYGVLDIDEYGFVTNMREKPTKVRSFESISCGIYVMSMDSLKQLTFCKEPYDFVDLVSSMLASGSSVFTYNIEHWNDIGTPQDLLDANLAYLQSNHLATVASLCYSTSRGEIWANAEMTVPSGFIAQGRVLLGPGVIIEPGAFLSNVIVGPGAIVHADTTLTNSMILMGASVAAHAEAMGEIFSK